MKQFVITPAAGKRLIGKAIAKHAAVVGSAEKENCCHCRRNNQRLCGGGNSFGAGSGKRI